MHGNLVTRMTHEEYQDVLQRCNRNILYSPTKPLMIEEFCTKVAWMGGYCPVYPYSSQVVCEYLSEKENYPCPAVNDGGLVNIIIREGNAEEKKMLEKLADNHIKYALRLRDPKSPLHNLTLLTIDDGWIGLISEALEIYKGLGKREKIDDIKKMQKGQDKSSKYIEIHETDERIIVSTIIPIMQRI